MADVETATEFFNICEIAETGAPDFELEEVRAEWEETDLARNIVLVLDPDEQIVASMQVTPHGGGIFGSSGYTHPEHRGRGLGSFVAEWSERRALSDPSSDSMPAKRLIRSWVSTLNPLSSALFTGRGYQRVRQFKRMEINLQEEPPEPVLPDGYAFRAPEIEQDLPEIYAVIDEAFAEHWSSHQRTFDEWKKTAMGFGYSPDFWSLIEHEGRIVAVAIGHNLAGLGWIKWVAVLKPARGKRLGLALLAHQFRRFWEAGVFKVNLGVDSENTTGAVELYERAGMTMINSYDAYEKELMADSLAE